MISDYLGQGAQAAITVKELVERTGINRDRIKHLVQKERLEGALIVSDTNGYYLASTQGEWAGFLAKTRAYLDTLAQTFEACDNANTNGLPTSD